MDVPAQVVNPVVIENHVKVVGGTNWDLSRSAAETPVYPLADPQPVTPARPMATIAMLVHFDHYGTRVPRSLASALHRLPKGAVLALRAGPTHLGRHNRPYDLIRKQAVQRLLIEKGFTVLPENSVNFSKIPANKKTTDTVEVFVVKD